MSRFTHSQPETEIFLKLQTKLFYSLFRSVQFQARFTSRRQSAGELQPPLQGGRHGQHGDLLRRPVREVLQVTHSISYTSPCLSLEVLGGVPHLYSVLSLLVTLLVQVEVFLFHTIFKNQNKRTRNFYTEHINVY